MKLFIYTLCLVLFCLSCTKEVDIAIPGYEEQIVVDGSIKTGQPAIVLLSTTANIYSPTNLEAYLSGFISGATVVVSTGAATDTLVEICTDNLPPGTEDLAAAFFGLPVEELINLNLCGYFSTSIVGEVGKTYSLSVDVNNENYSAVTSILQPTALDSLYWKPEAPLDDHGWSWAKLTDPAGSFDAYLWEVQRLNTSPDGTIDPLVYKPFNPYFNDDFFDGFPDASGNIDGTASGPRVSCDGDTFSSRSPRAAPYYQRILYKNKQRQHSLPDLARLGPLARRIFSFTMMASWPASMRS